MLTVSSLINIVVLSVKFSTLKSISMTMMHLQLCTICYVTNWKASVGFNFNSRMKIEGLLEDVGSHVYAAKVVISQKTYKIGPTHDASDDLELLTDIAFSAYPLQLVR